jgi:quinol monooxygenase YgiN
MVETTMYEYYLDTDEPQACYIQEAYKDVGSFQSHMQNVRPVLPGAENYSTLKSWTSVVH